MKKIFLTLVACLLLCFSVNSANAFTIVDSWELNLSVLNGEAFDGGTLGGFTDATNIDYVDISGEAAIDQTVAGGVAVGQSFVETGYIQFNTYHQEGDSSTSFFGIPNVDADPSKPDYFLYFYYDSLTGVLNNDGSITFDTGAAQTGTIKFYLTDEGDLDPTAGVGTDLLLGEFEMIAPSGGSDLNFYGGGGANATIDISLQVIESTLIDPLLFTDADGNPVVDEEVFIHLANTDSLLDDDFDPNPDNSGIDEFGNGISKIYVENAGQYKVAVIPEPTTMLLFGFGLLGIAGFSRRKNS